MLNEEDFYAYKHESEKFYKLAKCIENDTLQMKAKKELGEVSDREASICLSFLEKYQDIIRR